MDAPGMDAPGMDAPGMADPPQLLLGDLLPLVSAAALAKRAAPFSEDRMPPCEAGATVVCAATMHWLAFVTSLVEAFDASPFVLAAAFVLLGRLPEGTTPFGLQVDTFEYLFTMAYAVALKFSEDFHVTSERMAAVSGMHDVGAWIAFEKRFLAAIDYRCAVTIDDVWQSERSMVDVAMRSCMARDLYPELENLGFVPPAGLVAPTLISHSCSRRSVPVPSASSMSTDDAVPPYLPQIQPIRRIVFRGVSIVDNVAHGGNFVEADFDSASDSSTMLERNTVRLHVPAMPLGEGREVHTHAHVIAPMSVRPIVERNEMLPTTEMSATPEIVATPAPTYFAYPGGDAIWACAQSILQERGSHAEGPLDFEREQERLQSVRLDLMAAIHKLNKDHAEFKLDSEQKIERMHRMERQGLEHFTREAHRLERADCLVMDRVFRLVEWQRMNHSRQGVYGYQGYQSSMHHHYLAVQALAPQGSFQGEYVPMPSAFDICNAGGEALWFEHEQNRIQQELHQERIKITSEKRTLHHQHMEFQLEVRLGTGEIQRAEREELEHFTRESDRLERAESKTLEDMFRIVQIQQANYESVDAALEDSYHSFGNNDSPAMVMCCEEEEDSEDSSVEW